MDIGRVKILKWLTTLVNYFYYCGESFTVKPFLKFQLSFWIIGSRIFKFTVNKALFQKTPTRDISEKINWGLVCEGW